MKKFKHLRRFNQQLNESVTEHDFTNFRKYIKSIIGKNSKINFQVERTAHDEVWALKIGYFPKEFPSFADLSKELPEKVVEEIKSKLSGLNVYITSSQKRDPITDKMMRFTLITASNTKTLQGIEGIEF